MKNLNVSNFATWELRLLCPGGNYSQCLMNEFFWAKQGASQETKAEGIRVKVQNGNSDSNRNDN